MQITNLKIVYEDKAIIVFLKPAGIFSEGGSPNVTELLRANWGREAYVGLVHRLDTNTAGLMVVAKTPQGAAALSQQITDGGFHKIYLAAVEGAPPAEGYWQDELFKDGRQNKVFIAKSKRKGTKEARLRYRIAARGESARGECALARVELETGRTHQIRVQFAGRGFPLMGDGKYGSKDNHAKCALYAEQLSFAHPQSGEMLHFRAAPPAEEYPWNLFENYREAENDDQ